MTQGFGFSGAFRCGLFPDTVDNPELSVSVMVALGRDGNMVGKKHLIALDLGFNSSLPCINYVTLCW